jgi:hypothetical protein
MDKPTKKPEIDFRAAPPVKEQPPKEFKVRPKPWPKATLIALLVFILLTVLIYTVLPSSLPWLWQKLIGLVHAGSAAWVGGNAIFEFYRKKNQSSQAHQEAVSDKQLTPQQLAAREQKEHLLSHVQHHTPVKGRKRLATLVGSVLFILIFGWWWTGFAPIAEEFQQTNLSAELNQAAICPALVLIDGSFAIPTPVQPAWSTSLIAQSERRSTDPYLAGLQLIALQNYSAAKEQLSAAKSNTALPPEDQQKIELALAQAELFAGNYAAATKALAPMLSKKDPQIFAQQVTAFILSGEFDKARSTYQQLVPLYGKTASTNDKQLLLNLAVVLDVMQGRRTERAKQETESVALLKEANGPLAATLTNNISVAKTFTTPVQITAIQNQTNRALLVWNNSEVKIAGKNVTDRATSVPQLNLAIIDWLAGRYDFAEDNLTKANNLITGNAHKGPIDNNPADQLQRFRQVAALTLLQTTTGNLTEADGNFQSCQTMAQGLAPTHPVQIALKLLEIRLLLASGQRGLEAVTRSEELLSERMQTIYGKNHPLFQGVRLLLLEALLNVNQLDKAESLLAEIEKNHTETGWSEHPNHLTFLRLKAQWQHLKNLNKEASATVDLAADINKKLYEDPEAATKVRPSLEHGLIQGLKARIKFIDSARTPADLQAAIELLKKAQNEIGLAIGDEYRETNPVIGNFMIQEANLLMMANKPADAEQVLLNWQTTYLPALPAKHPNITKGLQALIKSIEAQSKDAKEIKDKLKELTGS